MCLSAAQLVIVLLCDGDDGAALRWLFLRCCVVVGVCYPAECGSRNRGLFDDKSAGLLLSSPVCLLFPGCLLWSVGQVYLCEEEGKHTEELFRTGSASDSSSDDSDAEDDDDSACLITVPDCGARCFQKRVRSTLTPLCGPSWSVVVVCV